MLNEHYYCKTEEETTQVVATPTSLETPAEPEPVAATVGNDTVEEDIDDLLKDL